MGEHTEIIWAEHTFNAWWGCTKVADKMVEVYRDRSKEPV